MKRSRLCQKYSADAICRVDGCDRRPVAQRMCARHYGRFLKNGTVELLVRRKPFADVADIELAIAAGLMEGEGSIRISARTKRNRGSLGVSIVNTNKQIIDWMNCRWPGFCKDATGLRPDQKPAWVWCLSARAALTFL